MTALAEHKKIGVGLPQMALAVPPRLEDRGWSDNQQVTLRSG